MVLDKQFLFNIFLFMLALLTSGIILYKSSHLKTSLPVSKSKPDLYMTEFEWTNFDAQGNKKIFITAPRMDHYPRTSLQADNNVGHSTLCFPGGTIPEGIEIIKITKPQVKIFFPDRPPLSIQSDEATALGNSTALIFQNNVKLNMSTDNPSDTLTDTTKKLTACPEQEFIYSKQQNTLSEPGFVLAPQTIQINLKTKMISFGAVQGSFTQKAPEKLKQDFKKP